MPSGISFRAATALLIALTSLTRLRAEISYHFSGVVVDDLGKPVPKARVEYYANSSLDVGAGNIVRKGEVFTDPQGRFDFKSPRRALVLIVKGADSAPTWTTITDPVDKEWRLIVHSPTSISGKVVDENKQPIPNAEVWCCWTLDPQGASGGRFWESVLTGTLSRELFSTRSAADGTFTIKGFPTSDMTLLAARKSGLASPPTSTSSESWFAGGASARAGQQNIEVMVEPTGSIAGQVTLGSTDPHIGVTLTNGVRTMVTIPGKIGNPVANSQIILKPLDETWSETQRVSRAAANGIFVFNDVPAGHYLLRGSADSAATPDYLILDQTCYVKSGESVTNRVLKVAPSGTLIVHVLSKQDGQPLVDATLEIGHDTYLTDENGNYSFRAPAGGCSGLARHEKYQDAGIHVNVIANQTSRVDVAMIRSPTIKGSVAGPSGKPASNVQITAFIEEPTPDFQTRSGADGSFELPWHPNYDRQLTSRSGIVARDLKAGLAGFAPLTGGTNIQMVKLTPGLTIAGDVRNETGQPLSGIAVRVRFYEDSMPVPIRDDMFSDQAGHFEMRALPAGFEYLVSAYLKGYEGSQTTVPAESNRTASVSIVLRRRPEPAQSVNPSH